MNFIHGSSEASKILKDTKKIGIYLKLPKEKEKNFIMINKTMNKLSRKYRKRNPKNITYKMIEIVKRKNIY